jgi:hypothetical protein
MNRITLSALAALGLLPSCTAIDLLLDPQPKFKAGDAMAVVPNDFLFTRYPPLNRWLDTPMRTLILDTPLKACFDHESLRGIRYQWVIEPKENPIINIDRIAITPPAPLVPRPGPSHPDDPQIRTKRRTGIPRAPLARLRSAGTGPLRLRRRRPTLRK